MTELIPFPSERWINRLCAECNQSESYREAARNWEGDFYFIVEAGEDVAEPVHMYIDLYHGRCRQAFVPGDISSVTPEFRISGPLRVWRAIALEQLDPLKALITRQLSIEGNMAKILKNARAAYELVNCTTKFETQFPDEAR